MRLLRTSRLAAAAFALVAVIGIVALVHAGTSDERHVAFSLDIAAQGPVASVPPHETACQGRFVAPAAFDGVQVWFGGVAGPGSIVAVSIVGASTPQPLAVGSVAVTAPVPQTPAASLSRAVPPGTSFSVCLRNEGRSAVPLLGFPATPGLVRIHGHRIRAAVSMIMLRPRPRSLVADLPVVFARAALFHPAWMGAWTFWVLLAGLALAFVLGWLALRLAADEED